MLRRYGTAVWMTGMEVLRGRLVLVLVAVIPTLFFLIAYLTTTLEPLAFKLGSVADGVIVTVHQRDEAAVFIGLGATGLLTSFIGLKLLQRDVESHGRLVLCGYKAWELLAAKLTVLLVVVCVVALYVSVVLPLVFF